MSFFILFFCTMLAVNAVFGLLIYIMFDASWVHCVLVSFMSTAANFLVTYGFYRRFITVRKDNAHLNQMVRTDKLTGSFNRAAFEQDINQIDQEGVSSVLFIDIDNFRNFNNQFGHMAGDTVLRKVCETIGQSVRTGDRAYRYGGEEIVVLLVDCGKENAYQLAEIIRTNISGLNNSPYPKISVSIGISTYPEDSDSIQTVVEMSDRALLNAKSKGKNRTEESDKEDPADRTASAE